MRIYPLNLAQKLERFTDLFTDGNERRNILWKARSAVAETGIKKAASDSFVCPNPIGNFFDVCSARLANG